MYEGRKERKKKGKKETPQTPLRLWSSECADIGSPTLHPAVEMFIQLYRCVDSAPVLAIICVTVLLAKGCVCVTEDEDDEVLEKKQLVEFYSKLPAGPLVEV